MDRVKLYEEYMENRSGKHLRNPGNADPGTIEPEYYKDILPQDKEEYEAFFQRIWTLPLLHNSRSGGVISAFWKEIVRRSYLASKSGVYKKSVVYYGDHPKQKFSIYSPKVLPKKPVKAAMFIHGGLFINGSQEAFEYLGKPFVQSGYIVITLGFRQLTKYTFYDAQLDIYHAVMKVIEIIGSYGGDNQDLTLITWSGGALAGYSLFFQRRKEIENHVKLFIGLGPPHELSYNEVKISKILFDQQHDISQAYPYYYFDQGPIKQKIRNVIGVKHLQFDYIYSQNVEWLPKYLKEGFDVTLTIMQNHDHYDLCLDHHIVIDKIREHQLDQIQPDNPLSRYFFMMPLEYRDQLWKQLKNPQWKPVFNLTHKQKVERTQKLFEAYIDRYSSRSLKNDALSHFALYEAASPLEPSVVAMLILHNSAVSVLLTLGSADHLKIIDDMEKVKRPIGFCIAELGCQTNPKQIGTTAFYNSKDKSFILDTITPFFKKYWCVGVGNDMRMCYAVIFAKLLIDKSPVSEGINTFLVKIAEPDGSIVKGVTVEDLGQKIGVNGTQNGSLQFSKVKLAKDTLLNKRIQINEAGKVESQIERDERAERNMNILSYWYVAICSSTIGILKAGLTIGIMFSRQRWNLSQNNKIQYPLLTFQSQQYALLPLIAKATSYNFLHNYNKELYMKDPEDPMCILLSNLNKSCLTEFAMQAVLQVSARVGAFGIINYNRLNEYLATLRALCTWGGDNKMLKIRCFTLIKRMLKNNSYKLPQTASTVRVADLEELKLMPTLLDIFRIRELAKYELLVQKYRKLRDVRTTPYEIMANHVSIELFSFIDAMYDRIAFEKTVVAMSAQKQHDDIELLTTIAEIFAADAFTKDSLILLMKGVIDNNIVNLLKDWQDGCIKKAALKVDFLIYKWNVDRNILEVPIADKKYIDRTNQVVRQNSRPKL